MNALESPIDALAFGYVSYVLLNIVNNLWTWVALVTAAVSFWRIRSAAAGASSFSVECDPPASTSNFPQKVREIPQIDRPFENPRVQTSVPASSEAVGDYGKTKGKFTVYYDDERERDGGLTGFREWEYKESDVLCGKWRGSWESVLRTRRGENSWYNHQDLAVINGNVVRLWDGGVCQEECHPSCAVW